MRFRTNGTNCPNGNARCDFNDVFNYFNYYGDDTEIVLSVITETLGTFDYVALWSSLEEDGAGINAKMPWTAWTSNQGGIIEDHISGREWGLRGTDPEPIYEIRFRELAGKPGLDPTGFCGCCDDETSTPYCTADGEPSPLGSCARACEDMVCASDPYCCSLLGDGEWDYKCVLLAWDMCFSPCRGEPTVTSLDRGCFDELCTQDGDCAKCHTGPACNWNDTCCWDCMCDCDDGGVCDCSEWPPVETCTNGGQPEGCCRSGNCACIGC